MIRIKTSPRQKSVTPSVMSNMMFNKMEYLVFNLIGVSYVMLLLGVLMIIILCSISFVGKVQIGHLLLEVICSLGSI